MHTLWEVENAPFRVGQPQGGAALAGSKCKTRLCETAPFHKAELVTPQLGSECLTQLGSVEVVRGSVNRGGILKHLQRHSRIWTKIMRSQGSHMLTEFAAPVKPHRDDSTHTYTHAHAHTDSTAT